MQQDVSFLDASHFRNPPVCYDEKWLTQQDSEKREGAELLRDDLTLQEDESSWSSELEEIHEAPMKEGWIEVYERERVMAELEPILSGLPDEGLVLEFGASSGYMIERLRDRFPAHRYIAADLVSDGLRNSWRRNPGIMHIQCDLTNAPFRDESMDIVYALNVLEHISDDVCAIRECYRMLKKGGYCLFVVPRGEKLYDYFDESLFHKRRYARSELLNKARECGFTVEEDDHIAWLCYPAFWLKKKWNQFIGRKLTTEQKMALVERDVKGAEGMPLALRVMHLEWRLAAILHPKFGIREVLLLRK